VKESYSSPKCSSIGINHLNLNHEEKKTQETSFFFPQLLHSNIPRLRRFISNYLRQRLAILTHSLFWWDIFLYESDVNLWFIRMSVCRGYNKF
jgi:hypothetical protein